MVMVSDVEGGGARQIVPIFHLTEHASAEFAIELTDADRARLPLFRRYLAVTELRSGVRVEARGWIGSVRFTHARLVIQPSLPGGMRTVWGMIQALDDQFGDWRSDLKTDLLWDESADRPITDYLRRLYRSALDKLIRGSLRQETREVRRTDSVIRGKLDTHALLTHPNPNRLPQMIQARTTDTTEHRLLVAALMQIDPGALGKHHPLYELRLTAPDTLRHCRAMISDTARTNRDKHYRHALTLAGIILAGSTMLPEQEGTGHSMDAFFLPLDRVFEAFAITCVDRATQSTGRSYTLQRSPRHSGALYDLLLNRAIGDHIPDAMLDYGNQRIIIDAKNKPYYANQPLSVADRNQIAAYLGSFSDRIEGLYPRGLVLYPCTDPAPSDQVLALRDVQDRPYATITAAGLPVEALIKSFSKMPDHDESVMLHSLAIKLIGSGTTV